MLTIEAKYTSQDHQLLHQADMQSTRDENIKSTWEKA